MQNVGELLRTWRQRRGRTQLQLAEAAGLSTRHLSFVENGRARPSREMIGLLCDALDLPLRDRNALLLAAGFAPAYSEHPLDADAMREAQAALILIMKAHEPFPAICLNRHAEICMANDACIALASALGIAVPGARAYTLVPPPRPNLVSIFLLHPQARARVTNWSEVANSIVERARRELTQADDKVTRALLEAIVAQSGLARPREPALATPLLLPLQLELEGTKLRLFSTITTFGTPFDITLAELRIEALHPADLESDHFFRSPTG